MYVPEEKIFPENRVFQENVSFSLRTEFSRKMFYSREAFTSKMTNGLHESQKMFASENIELRVGVIVFKIYLKNYINFYLVFFSSFSKLKDGGIVYDLSNFTVWFYVRWIDMQFEKCGVSLYDSFWRQMYSSSMKTYSNKSIQW